MAHLTTGVKHAYILLLHKSVKCVASFPLFVLLLFITNLHSVIFKRSAIPHLLRFVQLQVSIGVLLRRKQKDTLQNIVMAIVVFC